MIPFGAIVAAFGTAFFFILVIRPVLQTMDAREWVETPCTVQFADVFSHSDDDGTTYSIKVRYTYEVGGRTYTGERHSFHTGSSSSRGWRENAVRQLRATPETVCFVNPSDPSDAVLERGLTSEVWYGIIPLIFVFVGLAVMVTGFRGLFAKKAMVPLAKPVGSHRASPGAAWVPGAGELSGGPRTVDTGGNALKRFLGICIVALIWNGFLAFMVVMLLKGDGPPWIFIVLFGLVGLGLIAGAVYSGLALANPSARITLSQNPVPLGTDLRVAWQFSGNARRFDHLAIRLTCEEVASYRRGTRTVTERATMLDTTVMETRAVWEMAAGEVVVAVPDDTMHSFKSPNNAIEWKLILHGSIPRWPDVREEIALEVAPRSR